MDNQANEPSEKTPLRYRINPCDFERFPSLDRLGDFLAVFGSHCKCCSGARVLGAFALGIALGAWLL